MSISFDKMNASLDCCFRVMSHGLVSYRVLYFVVFGNVSVVVYICLQSLLWVIL